MLSADMFDWQSGTLLPTASCSWDSGHSGRRRARFPSHEVWRIPVRMSAEQFVHADFREWFSWDIASFTFRHHFQ